MLEISRKDIVDDYLMDFNEDRFIKLPIDGYMDLLGIQPNSTQTAIINAINNPKYRFISAAVARRQGKTYIANIIGFELRFRQLEIPSFPLGIFSFRVSANAPRIPYVLQWTYTSFWEFPLKCMLFIP